MDEPLGSSVMYSVWLRGSTIKTPPTSVPTTTANMYAALENISTDTDKRSMGPGGRPGGKDHYSSKGPSMERTYKQYGEGTFSKIDDQWRFVNAHCLILDGRGSRSGSQHRSNDSNSSSLTGPPSLRSSPAPSGTIAPSAPSLAVPKAAPVAMDEEQLERRLKNILEEYLNECCTIEECDQDIKESLPPSALPKLVSKG